MFSILSGGVTSCRPGTLVVRFNNARSSCVPIYPHKDMFDSTARGWTIQHLQKFYHNMAAQLSLPYSLSIPCTRHVLDGTFFCNVHAQVLACMQGPAIHYALPKHCSAGYECAMSSMNAGLHIWERYGVDPASQCLRAAIHVSRCKQPSKQTFQTEYHVGSLRHLTCRALVAALFLRALAMRIT